jgi:hypothetical protein
MLSIVSSLAALLLPLSMAWGASAMIETNKAHTEVERPASKLPRCEIRVDDRGESVVLEGFVFARAPISGSYQMRVSQNGAGGRAEITQSGEFNVRTGSASSLGIISLSNDHGSYVARLRIHWDSGAADCSEAIGGNTKRPIRTLF